MPSDGRFRVEKPFGETAWSVGKPSTDASRGGVVSHNRRATPRFPVRLVALVDHGKVGGRALALDVSRGGARVEMKGPLRALAVQGQALRFRMDLRPDLGTVELNGTVAWAEGDEAGMQAGIAFTDPWLVLESALPALLEKLAGEAYAK